VKKLVHVETPDSSPCEKYALSHLELQVHHDEDHCLCTAISKFTIMKIITCQTSAPYVVIPSTVCVLASDARPPTTIFLPVLGLRNYGSDYRFGRRNDSLMAFGHIGSVQIRHESLFGVRWTTFLHSAREQNYVGFLATGLVRSSSRILELFRASNFGIVLEPIRK
jgi:hypothetical protein